MGNRIYTFYWVGWSGGRGRAFFVEFFHIFLIFIPRLIVESGCHNVFFHYLVAICDYLVVYCFFEFMIFVYSIFQHKNNDNIHILLLFMTIVDCFIFYNELDMLEYRLSILYDIVDYFVICEASVTHVGKYKPFYYLENAEGGKFAKFKDKIIPVSLTEIDWYKNPDISKNQQWLNENMHRNGIMCGITQLVNDGKFGGMRDLLLISDVDEIPNPKVLSEFGQKCEGGGWNLCMDFYYYNLNTVHATDKWVYAKLVTYQSFVHTYNSSPQSVRMSVFNDTIANGGWHLSYFGDECFIKNKIENFAHQEYNTPEYTDIDKIKSRMENGRDIYERYFTHWNRVFLDDAYLPPRWRDFPQVFGPKNI